MPCPSRVFLIVITLADVLLGEAGLQVGIEVAVPSMDIIIILWHRNVCERFLMQLLSPLAMVSVNSKAREE